MLFLQKIRNYWKRFTGLPLNNGAGFPQQKNGLKYLQPHCFLYDENDHREKLIA